MAAKLYSDYSGVLTIFKTVERYADGVSATSFGLERWVQGFKGSF
jgi:hypothetical protein